jgi:hypothetical protein
LTFESGEEEGWRGVVELVDVFPSELSIFGYIFFKWLLFASLDNAHLNETEGEAVKIQIVTKLWAQWAWAGS